MERRSKLTELREAKCWTLVQAAQAVGVSINTINRWEMGKQKPHGYHLQQLCLVYGVEPEELELDDDGSSLSDISHTPLLTAFIAGDLTMRLLELTALPHRTFAKVQKQ